MDASWRHLSHFWIARRVYQALHLIAFFLHRIDHRMPSCRSSAWILAAFSKISRCHSNSVVQWALNKGGGILHVNVPLPSCGAVRRFRVSAGPFCPRLDTLPPNVNGRVNPVRSSSEYRSPFVRATLRQQRDRILLVCCDVRQWYRSRSSPRLRLLA